MKKTKTTVKQLLKNLYNIEPDDLFPPSKYLITSDEEAEELPEVVKENRKEWQAFKDKIDILKTNFIDNLPYIINNFLVTEISIDEEGEKIETSFYNCALIKNFLFSSEEETLNESFFEYLKKKGITKASRMLMTTDALILPFADSPSIDQNYLNYYFGGFDYSTYEEDVSLYGRNVIQLKTFSLFKDFLKEEQHKQTVITSINKLFEVITDLFIFSEKAQREEYIKALQATFNHTFLNYKNN